MTDQHIELLAGAKIQTGRTRSNGRFSQGLKILHTKNDRGAHRAESHREGVEHQADDRSSQRRKAKTQEQRRGQGGGRAETGSALDEGREHVADDDRLNPAVTGNILHPMLDGLHTTRILERVQNNDRTEDDDQNADRCDDALNGQGGDIANGQIPGEQCTENAHQPGQRHCSGRRPTQSCHQNQRDSDR